MALIPEDAVVEQEEEYASFENLHNYVSIAVEELILRTTNRAVVPNSAQVVIQQQPLKVPIPTFDGNYCNWPKFKAIFQDLMSNSGDTDAIKLYHLDKALVSDAAGILDAKVISEGNYQHAWEILTDRYENKRAIIESHIRGLLSLKKMVSESHKELRRLLNEATNHVESLRFLEQDIIGVSEHFVVYLIISSLDKSTRKAWESTQTKGDLPKYAQTIVFLKSRCQILENCEAAYQEQSPSLVKPKQAITSQKIQPQKSYAVSTSSALVEIECDICGGSHRNFQCSELNNLTAAQKSEKIRSIGICFNCLRKGHFARECSSDKTCRKCQRRHHTLLHEERTSNKDDISSNVFTSIENKAVEFSMVAPAIIQPTENQITPTTTDSSVSTMCSCNFTCERKTVLLLTAVVHALDKDNQPHLCRVLLDSGSQVNFVTEEMANILGIPKQRANVPITGINALRTLARDKVDVMFRSRVSSFQASIECLITPQVTGTIPTSKIDISRWHIPEGVSLADPEFYKPKKVDMLIGAELFFDVLKNDQLNSTSNMPHLRDTHLGWIITGAINEPHESGGFLQHSNLASIETIETLLQRFWQVEEVLDIPKFSTEELACEDHFVSTFNRDASGRFIVRLPLKDNVVMLNDCRALALKRFLMLERRLVRNPDLKKQYIEFMREYRDLEHCHEIIEANDPPNQKNYYMPHHAVLRPSSSSTKCRVVFDASAKSSSSDLSLNDVLLIGPVVQNDLYTIMLRFRKYKIAFSADISKMYRQILVAPDDQHYQRIFWREQPTDPLQVLELDTVTYGTASAPYQATRCLIQLANEETEAMPIAARIVKQEVYMDDILTGAETVEEAIEAQHQLKLLLSRGCFPIHKWCSNSQEFLQHIPQQDHEKQVALADYAANKVIKVLGLLWDPNEDTLFIAHHPQQTVEHTQIVTKRMIYAEVAKMYDPLGIFSPVIVVAKLIAQQAWKSKAGWDDPVEEGLAQEWHEFKRALPQINLIQVPRCVTFNDVVAYELHGFADASTVAYGACVYVRSLFTDGSAKLRLLSSKSKLAPLHELSVPRKELCAALLLTRLVERIIPALEMDFQDVVLWSDSTIVLAWITKPLNKLQLFVRNRIAEIQKYTGNYTWRYIRSQNNPADVVSRGQLPELLSQNCLWWDGPGSLHKLHYEITNLQDIPDDLLPEMKVVVAMPVVSIQPFPFFYKFSSFRKVQRIMGYVLRFISNCRKKIAAKRNLFRHLTIEELRKSTETILRVIQHVHLEDEIRRVLLNKPSKTIGNLRPIYIDGLLRVGGRLDRSQLSFENRHPIILPNKDPLVRNLIQEMHVDLLHVGQTGLLNAIRQRYWPLKARSTIRQITRRCVRCFRTNPTNMTQLMGTLPKARVVPSPPFAVTGIDYAGPFFIKQGLRRPALIKAYIAVYVCMATKAVHLEAVTDLSSDAFLASLQRFVSRRGLPQQLHSDNATNFKGANHELHELFRQFQNERTLQGIHEFCHVREIEWHFIPPEAPEFGGLWEAAVKSTKTHLKRIVGNVRLTYEELATVLAEIEAVLNSRPLFSISDDPASAHCLTGTIIGGRQRESSKTLATPAANAPTLLECLEP
ncbi:uncharacterized protein LOC131680122 [Topomyia yanbarensis]|uniref:uncharacterized protein LOC131680122 n=1 Tax=Topomyia yanbarensis TaxID=2498891 RepID=UPI00273BB398|nr:uncharacterized protein LOC131680122 [Topomyia yanbarensis]